MKTKMIFLSLIVACTLAVHAQSDYESYINKAMEKLEIGDCEGAQKYYNVFKDLSNTTKASIEVLINDCKQNMIANKVYAINDKITIDGNIYKVTHIEDKGKHGFAICDMGSGPLTKEMITKRMLPTRSEMKIIIRNRTRINLTRGDYWTIDKQSNYDAYYWSCAWSDWYYTDMDKSKGILYIYRF